MKTIFLITIIFSSTISFGQNKLPKDISNISLKHKNDTIFWTALSQKEYSGDYLKLDSNIYCGSLVCYTPEINVDVVSFQVLHSTPYSKDINNVYYYIDYMCDDCDDCCGGCWCDIFVIQDANPKTFNIIDGYYATDGTNIYLYGFIINDIDYESFKIIKHDEYIAISIDKNNVYLMFDIFEEADAKTFCYDEKDKRNNVESYDKLYIFEDKYNKWEFSSYKNKMTKINKQ
jgi:DKNYY family